MLTVTHLKALARRALPWCVLGLSVFAAAEAMAAVYFLYFSRTFYRPIYLERRDDHWLWRTEYHDWGGWHRPSSTAHHSERCFSVTYTSNSYGARDRERTMTETTKRAVVLGDSFIEGYGVDEPKRLSDLLEQHLGYEMLNFGMTNFGPLQYQILYDRLVREFQHDLVIVGVLPENDFVDNDIDFARSIRIYGKYYRPYYSPTGGVIYPRKRPAPNSQPFAAFADLREHRSWHDNLRHFFWLYGLRRELTVDVKTIFHPTGEQYIGYLEDDPARIEHVLGSLRAIHELAKPRPVLVVFIPDYRSWTYIEQHPEAYTQTVAVSMTDALRHDGIIAVDLLQAFMHRGLDKKSLYLPCDGHWSAAGHEAASVVLAPVVDDLLRHTGRVAASGRADR